MKHAAKFTVLFFALTLFLQSADENDFKKKYMHCIQNADIDIEKESIIIKNDDYEVEITSDYELYVNGKCVKTNADQKELVKEYHDLIFEIIDRAKEVGKEGAKLGIHGAKIGLQAIVGVFKLLRDDYDTDDLEEELELKSDELNEKAEELEKEAEKLEYLASDLEDLHEALIEEIPELEELDTF